ncbi:MAG: DUF5666 domain-containing protein [Chthoniobacteraceae bacterium]
MKRINQLFSTAAVAGAMLVGSYTMMAQDAVQTTTTSTTTAGTVSEFGPSTIVVKTRSDAEPMRYSYTKRTTYVDENGNPVSMETVRSGAPVTVYYDKEDGGMVARKVVVRKAVSADGSAVEQKTTTTSTAGTISEFDPNTIVVKSTTSAEPVRYSYTKTTTYVDENGNPVSMETVKSGLPVTVYYDRDGDNMVARKVVVRRATTVEPAPEAGTVIEHKKTTTTTTEDR